MKTIERPPAHVLGNCAVCGKPNSPWYQRAKKFLCDKHAPATLAKIYATIKSILFGITVIVIISLFEKYIF